MKMLSSDSAYDLGIAGIKWAEVLPWLSGTAFFYSYFHIRFLLICSYLHFNIEIESF